MSFLILVIARVAIFRTTPVVSSKLYFVEICQVSEKLWLFNHKKADFWLPNFGLKTSLLSRLKENWLILGVQQSKQVGHFTFTTIR